MAENLNPGAGVGPLSFIACPTPTLRAAVTQQQAMLPAADFAGMVGVIRSAFQKYTNRLLEFQPGSDRSEALHQLIDREIERAGQLPVTCRIGCCGCCHYEMEVTNEEAVLLAQLVDGGFTIDRERLRVQAARERKSAAWLDFRNPDNRCVFLADNGTCRIYEHRPAGCRKHFVTSPPEACTTAGGQVAPIQLLLVEILLSAALSIPGTSIGSMAQMLSPLLPEK